MSRVVLASGNPGKLRELSALLAPLKLALIAQPELGIAAPEESGDSFLANALIKARHAARHAQLPALADDSGLEVDALDGRPGVRSARYAGEGASDEENCRRLLAELRAVPESQRQARYQCVMALVRGAADPTPLIAEGSWEGYILEAPRGRGGFGYDPLFLPLGERRSAAELAPGEKNALSHRGKALRELVARLKASGYIA